MYKVFNTDLPCIIVPHACFHWLPWKPHIRKASYKNLKYSVCISSVCRMTGEQRAGYQSYTLT